MDLDLNEDQLALREMVTDFVDKEATITTVRDAEPLGFDVDLWTKVGAMGLQAITVPETQGGGGAGFLDLSLAVEQFGRTLAPAPLVEAAVGVHTLAAHASGSGPLSELLDAAVEGRVLPTIALHPAVDGVARLVPAGAVADVVVALDGDELVAIHGGPIAPTSPAEAPPNLGLVPIADRRLDEGERIVLATGVDATAAHERALHHWELLTAASLVGSGHEALRLGLDYVMERKAFGVLIGTFQSLQHHLADDATDLDGARLLALEAAWASDTGADDASELATMAHLFAGSTAFTTAAHCLQYHGGYGYTLEYDIQLYFRRAKASQLIAGDPRARQAELAHRLFDAQEV